MNSVTTSPTISLEAGVGVGGGLVPGEVDGAPGVGADEPVGAGDGRVDVVRLIQARLAEYVVVAIFFVSMAAYEWVRWVMQQPPQPVLMTIFASLMVAYVGVRAWLVWLGLREVRADAEGQRLAREALVGLGERGYFLFEPPHAEPEAVSTGAVLVGPNGVFALTCRSFSRGKSPGEAIVKRSGGRLMVGRHEAVGNPLVQAQRVADWVGRMMDKQAGLALPVRPVLLCPGWEVRAGRERESGDAVIVANEDGVATVVAGQRGYLAAGEIISACEAMSAIYGAAEPA